MSYLLDILGRGLIAELAAAFREFLPENSGHANDGSTHPVEHDQPISSASVSDALRLLEAGRFVDAREAFGRLSGEEPSNIAAGIGLACALDQLGHTREAARTLRRVLEFHSKRASLWFGLGFCHEKTGDTDEAVAAYERAVELDPQLRNPHERLAAIHLRHGDTGGAIEHYEVICGSEPADAASHLSLAELYLRAHRFDDAARRYEYAAALEPDSWEIRDDMISALVGARRFEEAVDLLAERIRHRPECADQYVRLGDVYAKMGRERDSMEAYEKALSLNPDYLEATVKAASLRLRDGHFEQAALTFARAVEINDRLVHGYVGLGVARHAMGQHEEAMAALETASTIEPNSALLFSEVARLRLKSAAAEEVERYLSPAALVAEPEGTIDDDVRDVVSAHVAHLRAAIAEHPNHADLHYRLGVLLKHGGDLNGAIQSLRQAVAINPRYLKALTRLGFSLRECGDHDAALDVFRNALSIDAESADLHYQLGLVFADQRRFNEAVDQFEQAARKDPSCRDHVANLALALQNMGLLDRAQATWQTLLVTEGAIATGTPSAVPPSPFRA